MTLRVLVASTKNSQEASDWRKLGFLFTWCWLKKCRFVTCVQQHTQLCFSECHRQLGLVSFMEQLLRKVNCSVHVKVVAKGHHKHINLQRAFYNLRILISENKYGFAKKQQMTSEQTGQTEKAQDVLRWACEHHLPCLV